MLKKRVEVLFEPTEYQRLAAEAQKRHRSVGWMVREAVQNQYLTPTLEEKQAALKRLFEMQIDFGTWEEAKELINQMYDGGMPEEE